MEHRAARIGEEVYSRAFTVHSGDYDRAGETSSTVKGLLKQVELDPGLIRRICIALFEAEMNVVIHAYEGEIQFELTPTNIEITVKDRGPGIEDIELAMQEGFSTAGEEARSRGFGAGMGLSNMKKNSDRMKIETKVGVGTTVKMEFDLGGR